MTAERIVTPDGITVDLVADTCRYWEWGDTEDVAAALWKAAAELIGPVILRAIVADMFAHSTVDQGRFVIGMQGMEGDIDITFDADKVIDWWIDGESSHKGGFGGDDKSKQDGMVIVRWLETQAARLREFIGEPL